MIRAGLALALAAIAAAAAAHHDPRSRAERARFRAAAPCPATGQLAGPCPGHEVDHVQPLCAGGADVAANMQWLTVEAHRAKSAAEKRQHAGCRRPTRADGPRR